MDTLKDLYIDQLQDLWSANKQALKITNKLCDAANNEQLCDFLNRSDQKLHEHNDHLERIIRSHNAEPDDEHCKGMEGLAKEARKHALEKEYTNKAVQDAQIISQYQRISHYAIAGYGTCRSIAEELGYHQDATSLQNDLEEIEKGDKLMSSIAEESVNRKAAA